MCFAAAADQKIQNIVRPQWMCSGSAAAALCQLLCVMKVQCVCAGTSFECLPFLDYNFPVLKRLITARFNAQVSFVLRVNYGQSV